MLRFAATLTDLHEARAAKPRKPVKDGRLHERRLGLTAGSVMTGGPRHSVAPLRRMVTLHRPYERHR
jgi:hypothetical protein